MAYFDAASAEPVSPAAREALLAALDDGWADPVRLHREGRRASLLLDQARELDLRSPHQDFFDPIWRQGWRAGDLVHIGSGRIASVDRESPANGLDVDNVGIES